MVGILCLLLAFAVTDLRAQGEVVFSGSPSGIHSLQPDTLPAFRLDWAARSGRLLRRHAVADDSLLTARHRQAQDRLQAKQYIRLGAITHRLSPSASGQEVHAALQRMDSVRQALLHGADFAALGGQEHWCRLAEQLQEWTDVLATLSKDSVSQPFVSPLGVHLVRWTDSRAEEPVEVSRQRLERWTDRQLTADVPFHTDLDSLCLLYPKAETELRTLYARMIAEYRGDHDDSATTQPSQSMTKAERKAQEKAEKQAAKARQKAEKEAAKAERQAAKERKKQEKRKNIVKKQ
jgi:hypothetical protein